MTGFVTPRVFASYSHDSQSHKDWVLMLATRRVANGVDVILDQWDVRSARKRGDQPANVLVKDNEGNLIQFVGK